MYKAIPILLMLMYTVLFAQSPDSIVVISDSILSVKKAVQIAEMHNPQINRIRQRIEGKKGEWWTGFGLQSPQLFFQKEGIGSNNNSEFTEKKWMISQPIDFPLKSYYRLNRLRSEQKVLEFQLQAQSLELKSIVKSAYIDLAYAQKILGLREEQLKIAQELKNTAEIRVETGEAAELDLMKAEIQFAEAENDLSDAKRLLHQSRYNLFNNIGLDPESQQYGIRFPDTLAYINIDIKQYNVMDKLALQPQYLGAETMRNSAAWGEREAWSDFLPDLQLNYFIQDFGSGYDFHGYEIGLRIPLWFPLNQRGNIQAAKAVKHEAAWSEKAVALDLKQQVENAWHGYEVSIETVKRYELTIRRQSQSLLARTLEGYRLGELTILDLLDAQRTYLHSQKRYYDALRDVYLQLSELEKFWGSDIIFQE